MNYTEHATVFPCAGEWLIGVLSMPERACETAVIVIVGGPQYRAGSHRQFVLLARSMAQAGHAVLRFDHRGMGDSGGEQRDFQAVSTDLACAIDMILQRTPGAHRVVLWGLCDGASAALLYLDRTHDSRVAGLCLVNPWVRSATTLARAHVKQYYGRRLMQRAFWLKLIKGGVSGGAVLELVNNLRRFAAGARTTVAGNSDPADFRHRMAAAWQGFGGDILLLLSGADYTAREFIENAALDRRWRSAMADATGRLERHDLPAADHTFSDPSSHALAERATLAWLERIRQAAPGVRRDAPSPFLKVAT